jgi:hypothetical protein
MNLPFVTRCAFLTMLLAAATAGIPITAAVAADAAPPMRAMWVYETADLLHTDAARGELLEFCVPRKITDLFLQTHFVAKAKGGSYEIADAAALRGLLREAKARGLRVHALAGDPAHTLRENHEKVLARVEAFAAFNEGGAKDERFAGLHFDIEPHALPQWKKANDAEKAELLTQFVELNAKVVERLHERSPDALYGADITFWLDKTKPDGTPVYPVTFRGVTTDATRHLLGFVDQLGVMSYRGTVEGENGMIAIVARSIASADKAKGRVFVGVKMANIGARMETFYGHTEQEMDAELRKVDAAYSAHRGYAGLAYFMYAAFKTMPPK